MRRPTRKALSISLGVGALAVAAIAIPAWAAGGSDERKPSFARGVGAVQRGGRLLPVPSARERRRLDQRLEEFRTCMDEQGIDLPEPPQGGRGFAIPLPPPPPGFRGRFERAPEPGEGGGRVELAPIPGGDQEAFEQALKECGDPPFPSPQFGARLRGAFHQCAAPPPPRH